MTILTTFSTPLSEVNPTDEARLMDNLRTRLPGALDGVIFIEAFNAYNEFFDTSSVWTDSGLITTSPGVQTYIVYPSRGRIIRLVSITDNENGISQGAVMRSPGVITLDTVPADSRVLRVEVVLTINPRTATDTGLPDVFGSFYAEYFDAALNGILAYMLSQPAKPYSNINLARLHAAKFQSAIAQARHEATHGSLQRGQAWRFPSAGIPRRRGR
jgi:hypothetical protein